MCQSVLDCESSKNLPGLYIHLFYVNARFAIQIKDLPTKKEVVPGAFNTSCNLLVLSKDLYVP